MSKYTLIGPKSLVKRAFLNNEENGGIAVAVLDVDPFSFGLQITDCNRAINLHNDIGNAENRANALYKLRTLRDVCQAGINYIEKLPAPTDKIPRVRKGRRRLSNGPTFFAPDGLQGVPPAIQARTIRMVADMIEGNFEEARTLLVTVRQEVGVTGENAAATLERFEVVEFLDGFDRELTRREKKAQKAAKAAAKKLEAAQAAIASNTLDETP